MTLYDLPTGYGGLTLYLLGGPKVVPVAGYMGGKRTLAPTIAEALGVQPGLRPDRVVLADAGCPGWVWPELLDQRRAGRLLDQLQSWGGRDGKELWYQLADAPIPQDPTERAAVILVLQTGNGRARPLEVRGERWKTAGYAHLTHKAVAKGFKARISLPALIKRVQRVVHTLARHPVSFHHGDIFDVLDARAGDLVYLDPDYRGCTPYGFTVPRQRLLDAAEDLRARGVTVGISEAVPLPLPGWWHLNLTVPGGLPEWLTLSREPVRRQGQLWSAVAGSPVVDRPSP